MKSRKNLSAHIPSASWKDWKMEEAKSQPSKTSHISPARYEHMKGNDILQHNPEKSPQPKVVRKVSHYDLHKNSGYEKPPKPLVKKRDPNLSLSISSVRSMDEEYRPGRKQTPMSTTMLYGSGNDNKSPNRSADPTQSIKRKRPITASKINLAGCYLLLDDPETKNRKKLIQVDYSKSPQPRNGPKRLITPMNRSDSFRGKEEYIGIFDYKGKRIHTAKKFKTAIDFERPETPRFSRKPKPDNIKDLLQPSGQ